MDIVDSLKISSQLSRYNNIELLPNFENSRLQISTEKGSSESSGSIFDGQEVVIEPSTATTTPSSSTSPRSIVQENEENPNADLDERFSHMMSIENTEPEKNATITESPTNTSTNTTEATKEEIPTVIQYVVKENPENYNLKDFHSNVYDLVYPNEDKDSILYGGMLFAVLLAIIFTIKFSMSIIKQISFFRIPAYKMIPVYSFLRDLTILMLVLSVLIGMAHYHKLDFIHSNIVTILYGFYIFILLWITISIILLYTSYLQLRRFFEFETISKDISKLNELKRFYEDLWMENQQIHHLVKDQIQFQLMRQSFIYPVELPILTECFLKREFDFSSYLGYCISDFLGDIVGFINFKMGVILIILGLAFKLLKEIDNEKTQNVMFYTTPLITLVILFIVRWHLRSIYSYLVPEVSKPELINFQVDIDIIDPFDHYDNLQVPPYLEDTENNHGEDESAPRDSSDKDSGTDEDDSEFEITKKPKDTPKNSGINESKMIKDSAVVFVENEKKTNNRWMFKSGKRCCCCIKQNRHQRLFCCGRFGLFICQFLIQACFLTNLIWLTALIAGKGKDRFYVFDDDAPNIIYMIIWILISAFTLLYFFPTVVFSYVLDTSIQMMKRRDYIEIVNKEQKHLRALRSMRMYQVFKLIRRELIDFFNKDTGDKNLRSINIRIIKENYDIVCDELTNEIDSNQLNELFPLCGTKLKKLESYVLLKKANSEGDSVKYKGLMNAVMKTTNDVKIDPYDVIITIFLLLLREKDKLSINEVENFFKEYDGYFEKEDVDEFMEEILSLQRDSGLIDIQEIASLIRDDIECFPR